MGNFLRKKSEPTGVMVITPKMTKQAERKFKKSHSKDIHQQDIKDWLFYGVNPNILNKDGDSMISWCIKKQEAELLKKCLERRGDANGKGNYYTAKEHYHIKVNHRWFSEVGKTLKRFVLYTLIPSGICMVPGVMIGATLGSATGGILGAMAIGGTVGFGLATYEEITKKTDYGWPLYKDFYKKDHPIKRTHLKQAIYMNSDAMTEALLDNGANPRQYDDEGSPSSFAVKLGHESCFDLVEAKKDESPLKVIYTGEYKPLKTIRANYKIKHFDFANGSDEDFENLVNNHADINSLDKNDSPILVSASAHGRLNIVHLLLTKDNINIEAKNKNGEDALVASIKNGHMDVTELLWPRFNPLNHDDKYVKNLLAAVRKEDKYMRDYLFERIGKERIAELQKDFDTIAADFLNEYEKAHSSKTVSFPVAPRPLQQHSAQPTKARQEKADEKRIVLE